MPLPKDYAQGSEYEDLRGNTIKIGDTVVYAALSGRSCQLCEATVLDVAVKTYQKDHQEGEWVWDGVSYEPVTPWNTVPREKKTYQLNRKWTTTEYDYKLQLQPTGRYGRWKQHSVPQVYDSVLGKYVETGDPIKPRWVMAEQAALVR